MIIEKKPLQEQYMIYGTMGLGGEWGDEKPVTKKDIDEGRIALDTALECGITFFDLADIYKSGKSEIVFGHYLKENPDLREKIIIQSKVGIILTGAPFGSRFDYSYSHIIDSVDVDSHRLSKRKF